MPSHPIKIAIFGNECQHHNEQAIARVVRCLAQRNAETYVDKPFLNFLRRNSNLPTYPLTPFTGNDFDAQLALSLGGDGTFLKAAGRVGHKQIPIVGINMGRLGFLAGIPASEAEDALNDIFDGNYKIEEHAVIMVEAGNESFGGNPFAVNDIAILKRDDASMITIGVCVDGERLVTYQADGLIVATQAGSTAYNLSNGGPIVVPGTNALCLTAVAPHSLNVRPIVLPGNVELHLRVESRSHNYLIAIDGRSTKLVQGTEIRISKAPYVVKMVRRNSQTYFATLRNKMMWGADNRNHDTQGDASEEP